MAIFPTRAETFAEFEQMGEDRVRLWLDQGPRFAISLAVKRLWAIQWLSKFDYEARLRNETSQAESLETAKDAKDAAWAAATAARDAAEAAKNANNIAVAALIAAMIAIAVSVFSAFLGR